MTDKRIEEIKARLEKAGPEGKWLMEPHSHISIGCKCMSCYDDSTCWLLENMIQCCGYDFEDNYKHTTCEDLGFTYADADFIENAYADIEYLLERLK